MTMKRATCAAVVLCIAVSACGSPNPPPAATKALTDDEFLQKLSAELKTASSTPMWSDYDSAGAFDVCKQFVLDGLKAPTSAKFPHSSEATMSDLGGGRFRVLAYVDSQNSFGAMIRNNYNCAVHWVSGTQWSLDNLKMESR